MACFAKGKGKKRQTRELRQFGTVLCLREETADYILPPKLLELETELEARAELEELGARWLAERFEAVDSEAKALAARRPMADQEPRSAPWPIRVDLHLPNETNGLLLTSLAQAGCGLDSESPDWNSASREGRIPPLELLQDDSVTLRVVGGQPLTSLEQAEWVAHLEWTLQIPDGQLLFSGGAEPLTLGWSAARSDECDFWKTLTVPPGTYLVDLYSYLPGSHAEGALDHCAGGYGMAKPFGAWWRETRPGEPFPVWLRQWCVADRSQDPGHEKTWEGTPYLPQEETPTMVHFVVQLTPHGVSTPTPEQSQNVHTWVPFHQRCRRPDRCPRGLLARGLSNHGKKEDKEWNYVHEVAPLVQDLPLSSISGGPVLLGPHQFAQLYQLARFCHLDAVPGLSFSEDLSDVVPFKTDQHCKTVVFGDHTVLFFANNFRPVDHHRKLQELGPCLAGLPVGTSWELHCARTAPNARSSPKRAGFHRYAGRVTAEGCCLEQSYPACEAEELQRAMTLATQVEKGELVELISSSELEPLLAHAKVQHGCWLDDNDVVLEGLALSLRPPDPSVLAMYGASAFALRFGNTWPVLDLSVDAP